MSSLSRLFFFLVTVDLDQVSGGSEALWAPEQHGRVVRGGEEKKTRGKKEEESGPMRLRNSCLLPSLSPRDPTWENWVLKNQRGGREIHFLFHRGSGKPSWGTRMPTSPLASALVF